MFFEVLRSDEKSMETVREVENLSSRDRVQDIGRTRRVSSRARAREGAAELFERLLTRLSGKGVHEVL